MLRRSALLFLAVCALAGGQERPNFVFLLGEGQGWSSTSVRMDPDVADSKHPIVETPNLARIAHEGMVFSRFYAPSPRCTPSRAAYLTGMSPARLGITFVSRW